MAIIAQDTFTVLIPTIDENISAHISDTPGANPSWDTDGDGSEMVVEADTNDVRGATDSNRWVRHTADVGDDDMKVSAKAKSTNTSNRRTGVLARVPTGVNGSANSYNFYLEGDGTNVDAYLDKRVASVETNLGSYALNGTQGTYYTLRIETTTGAKDCYIDGTLRITTADDVLTGNNFGGMRLKRNDTNVRLDDFLLEDNAGAAAGQPTMRRWGGVKHLNPEGSQLQPGRGW